MTILRLRQISKHYARAATPALDAVDLEMAAGECVAITGASGAGKTTLLHVIGGLLAADGGSVEIAGARRWCNGAGDAAAFRRRSLGMLLQGGQLFPELDVETNVALPLLLDRRRDAHATARAQLASCGIAALATRRPHELSGGETVRVGLARALVSRPVLLLADEPTANLDDDNAGRVTRLLQTAAGAGTAVLVVTHDHGIAAVAQRRLRLDRGRLK